MALVECQGRERHALEQLRLRIQSEGFTSTAGTATATSEFPLTADLQRMWESIRDQESRDRASMIFVMDLPFESSILVPATEPLLTQTCWP